MAGPIYELWMSKPTEAFYQLSDEQRGKLFAKGEEALANVGGKTVIGCSAPWSSDQFLSWGVEEYPDFAAAQRHAELLRELTWHRYFTGTVILGIKWGDS